MVDPISAFGMATAAFNAIKKGFEVGRDIESMSGDLSRWMGSVSDINKADEYAKKPPIFKKLFAAGSVEEEAMATFMAKKKAEDMRYMSAGDHLLMSILTPSTLFISLKAFSIAFIFFDPLSYLNPDPNSS